MPTFSEPSFSNPALAATITLDDSQLVVAAERVKKSLGAVELRMRRLGQAAEESSGRLSLVEKRMAFFGRAAGKAGKDMGAASRGFNAFNNPAVQTAFILNDLQQFSFGFSQGLRAISNNLTPLLTTMRISTKVLGPLILATEAISTAIVLWSARTREAKRDADSFADGIKNLTRSMLETPAAPRFQVTMEATERAIKRVTDERNELLGTEARLLGLQNQGLRIEEGLIERTKRRSDIKSDVLATLEVELERMRVQEEIAAEIGVHFERIGTGADEAGKRIGNMIPRVQALKGAFQGVAREAGDALMATMGPEAALDYLTTLKAVEERVERVQAKLRGPGRKPGDDSLDDLLKLDPATVAAVQITGDAIDTMADGFADLVTGAENFGEVMKRIMQRVIGDIAAAVARMAILKGLMSIPGLQVGFVGSVLRAVAGGRVVGGGGSGGQVARAPVVVGLVRGQDLALIQRETSGLTRW